MGCFKLYRDGCREWHEKVSTFIITLYLNPEWEKDRLIHKYPDYLCARLTEVRECS